MAIEPEILIKRGDQLPTLQSTLVYDDGSVIDLTGTSVTFQYRKRGMTATTVGNCSIIDPVNGVVEYQWLTTDIVEPGPYVADFEIIFADGKHLTVPTQSHIRLVVEDDLGDVTPPEVGDEEDTLDQGAKYLYARNYSGTTGGEQILNAINALPSTGGVVDTRGLGDHVWNFSYASVSKPVSLLLWSGRISIHSNIGASVNVRIYADHDAIFVIDTGMTLTLGFFDGALTPHFSYSGTGKVVFSATTPQRVFYPEWWGACADNATASLDGLFNASQALPARSKLQLQAGTYNAGSTAAKPCMWPQNDFIEIAGAGREATEIQYISSYQNSNVLGGCLFYGDQAHAYATTRQSLYIHDFAIHDMNTGVAFDFAGINPSCFTAVFVTDITIDRVRFKDCKGNAAVTAVGANLAQDDNGKEFHFTNSVLEGTQAGGWIEFSGVNTAGWGSGSIRNNYASGVSIAAFGFNDGNTKSLPSGIVIDGNTADFLSRGNINAQCIRVGAGHGIHITHNTCLNMTDEQIGIATGEETGNTAAVKLLDVWITDNVIHNPSTVASVGIQFSGYTIDGVHVLRNNIKAVVPFSADVRNEASANGPGLKTIDFGDNQVDCLNVNCTVFNITQSEGVVPLSTGSVMLIHGNLMLAGGFDAKFLDWQNVQTLKNPRVRLWENQWPSNIVPRNTLLGMPYFALGLPTVPPGGMGSAVQTYYGALPGDQFVVIGLNGGEGPGFQPIPPGVQIWAYCSTADTFTVVVRNGSTFAFDPTGPNTPLIIGERRR